MDTLRACNRFAGKYTGAWIGIVVLAVACTVTHILLPQIAQLIVDRIVNPALGAEPVIDPNNLFAFVLEGFAPTAYWGMFGAILLVYGCIFLVRYATHFARWWMVNKYGLRVEMSIRHALFDKMIEQAGDVLNKYSSGDLMTIANADPVTVKDMYANFIPQIVDQSAQVVLAVVCLGRIDAWLLIVPAIAAAATVLTTVFYTRRLRASYRVIRDRTADLATTVQENINGVRIIRAFASEDLEIAKFRARNDAFRDAYLVQARVSARYGLIFGAITQTINIASVIAGIVLCVNGSMSVGQFATFTSYVFMINSPMINITNNIGFLQNALVSGTRIISFLDEGNPIPDPVGGRHVVGEPSLELRHACVRLDNAEEIVDVSVDLPYGKTLGIMGKTGAGKSVLMKALARFVETTDGETILNGENIKTYDLEDVRRQFSYVMQDVFLFSNTVDFNIALYDPEAPFEKVRQAAACAEADAFIVRLADGYDTIVGERGIGLSGGQKQRVSIARALLKNAPILLLDDCTSALDAATERKVLANVRAVYKGKTLVIASHRASSVADCDEIVYLENGRIVERGTHDELMALHGRYYDVFTRQAGATEE